MAYYMLRLEFSDSNRTVSEIVCQIKVWWKVASGHRYRTRTKKALWSRTAGRIGGTGTMSTWYVQNWRGLSLDEMCEHVRISRIRYIVAYIRFCYKYRHRRSLLRLYYFGERKYWHWKGAKSQRCVLCIRYKSQAFIDSRIACMLFHWWETFTKGYSWWV